MSGNTVTSPSSTCWWQLSQIRIRLRRSLNSGASSEYWHHLGPRMDDTVGNSCKTYFSLHQCQEIDVQCHKLRQNGPFVSKFPSSVATVLQSHFQVQLLNLNLITWTPFLTPHDPEFGADIKFQRWFPGRGRSWITGLAGISRLGPNSEPRGNNRSFPETRKRTRVPMKIGSRDSIFDQVNSTYFF